MIGNVVRIGSKEKGFGFILGEDKNDYFFHITSLKHCEWRNLELGTAVEFVPNLDKDKLVAKHINLFFGESISEERSNIENGNTYVGKHPLVKLEKFDEQEKNIIKTLSRTFYITNGGTKIILGSTSEYSYCLLKPTDYFGEQFNLKREIVVIFSNYEKFEPRTFDAIAEVYRKNEQKFRIDRVCSVIISKDNNVIDEIRQILKNDLEMQVVVPFSYIELQNGDRTQLITNRFREHFYERDLFAFESPLKKDLYFFGRREYVHELISRHNCGENSGVFGLRRSGKTSVLQAVDRAAKLIDTACIFLDCQDIYHFSWNRALFMVIEAISKCVNIVVNSKKDDYDDENANALFAADLEYIITCSKRDILLLIDEIEQITPGLGMKDNWKQGDDFVKFWHTIRSNFHKWGNKFTFIIAGTNPSGIEQISINKHDNPLFNQLKADSYLLPFKVHNTSEMVNKLGGYMGISFDDIVCAKLTHDFGGHPYLIRHFCSSINQYITDNRMIKPIRITNAIYSRVMPVFAEKAADNYCRFILGVLIDYYPEENKFLEQLALGNLEEGDRTLYNPQMISHLVGYGIIENNQGVLDFKIDVLKNYLTRKYAYRRQNITNEEKWAEISERRNRIEPKIRTIIRMQLKTKYGNGARQEVLNSMRIEAREKYKNLKYNDLFNPKKCEIYFMQLGYLIENHWEMCFKNIFSKNKATIKSYFTIINNLRLECHAAPVTDEEMDSFRGAIRTLEKEVENYFI